MAVVVWGAHLALFTWHDTMPWPLTMVAFAVLGGWYMSLQHETLHGHPSPWPVLNAAIAWVPWSLWLPFRVYRDSHLLHHDIDLTLPGVDPESFYVSPAAWDRMGRVPGGAMGEPHVRRPARGGAVARHPWETVIGGVREARRDTSVRRTWFVHVAAAVAVGWLVFGVSGSRGGCTSWATCGAASPWRTSDRSPSTSRA
ncbi:MAG: fatty acid desaturase [Ilumatobacteraceae bacterium]